MAKRTVTKLDFLTTLGCTTRAWYAMRKEGGAPTPADLLRMEEGKEVHQRARSLRPSGVCVGSIAKTQMRNPLTTGNRILPAVLLGHGPDIFLWLILWLLIANWTSLERDHHDGTSVDVHIILGQ